MHPLDMGADHRRNQDGYRLDQLEPPTTSGEASDRTDLDGVRVANPIFDPGGDSGAMGL